MIDLDWGGEVRDAFPQRVREILADNKRAGVPWDIAWKRAIRDRPPSYRGWTKRNGEPESAMETLERAMRAAYHDEPLVSPYPETEAA